MNGLVELVTTCGGRWETERSFRFGRARIDVSPLPSYVYELTVPVERPIQLSTALEQNPETGWSFCLRAGAVARRALLTPAVWTDAAALSPALRRLSDGEPCPDAAEQRVPLFPLRRSDLASAGPELEEAALVLLFARAGHAHDGTRPVVPRGSARTVFDVELAGRAGSDLRAAAREAATLIRALATCPPALTMILTARNGSPSARSGP